MAHMESCLVVVIGGGRHTCPQPFIENTPLCLSRTVVVCVYTFCMTWGKMQIELKLCWRVGWTDSQEEGQIDCGVLYYGHSLQAPSVTAVRYLHPFFILKMSTRVVW